MQEEINFHSPIALFFTTMSQITILLYDSIIRLHEDFVIATILQSEPNLPDRKDTFRFL